MRTAVLRVLLICLSLVVGACSAGARATATPPLPTSGLFTPGTVPTMEQLCALLTPEDWAAAGLADADEPLVDDDGPGTGSAYCVYDSESGAAGGLELDVFVDQTLEGAMATYATIAESLPPSSRPNISGIDDGLINTAIDETFGAILVRVGRLVVTITLPTSAQASDQLISLTNLVLSRARELQ
jgi:hypothetical protein